MAGSNWRPDRDDTDVIGSRIGAQIVDNIITVMVLYVPILVFGMIGGSTGEGGFAAGMGLFGLLIGVVLAAGYHFLLEGLWEGYTVGKKLFGILVVKESGEPCDIGASVLRNILDIIDSLFYYAIGFIFMAMSDKRQRLGDRLAGTVVVSESSVPDGVTASQQSAQAVEA